MRTTVEKRLIHERYPISARIQIQDLKFEMVILNDFIV
jgi:hypothetical protein